YIPEGVSDGTVAGIVPTMLSVGVAHSCTVTSGRFAYCWGLDAFGQLGDGGTSNSGLAVRVLADVDRVAADQYHTCAIKSDHSVWCWGRNMYGELGQDPVMVPQNGRALMVPGLVDAREISIGGPGYSAYDDYSCTLLVDGSIWCWGSDLYGQLGDGR